MFVDISKLLNGSIISVDYELNLSFRKEDLDNIGVIELNGIANGKITKLDDNLYDVIYNIEGKMILPDAVTLENVIYPFQINDENEYEIGEKLKISENLLDIYEVLWENVVLEVPLRVTNSDGNNVIEGNGWSLNKKFINNSGLEGLKNLLDLEEKDEHNV